MRQMCTQDRLYNALSEAQKAVNGKVKDQKYYKYSYKTSCEKYKELVVPDKRGQEACSLYMITEDVTRQSSRNTQKHST